MIDTNTSPVATTKCPNTCSQKMIWGKYPVRSISIWDQTFSTRDGSDLNLLCKHSKAQLLILNGKSVEPFDDRAIYEVLENLDDRDGPLPKLPLISHLSATANCEQEN